MTRKTFFRIIFGIIGFAFLGAAYVYFFALSPQSINIIPEPGGSPSSSTSKAPYTPPPPPTGDTFTLGTSQGSVTMQNFYRNAYKIISDGNVVISRTDDYDFLYYPQDSSFLITISNTPVPDADKRAEKDFLTTLNISEVDACKLKIAVRVPYSVDPGYVGQELGLSFCANRVQSN